MHDIPRLAYWTGIALKGPVQAPLARDPQRDGPYRALFESNPHAMLLVRPGTAVIRANEAARALFGMTERQMREGGRACMVAPEDPRWRMMAGQCERAGRAQSELTLLRGDGSRFEAEVRVTRSRLGDGSLQFNVSLSDISAQMRAPHELPGPGEPAAALEGANSDFVGFALSLAHDLRAPLDRIEGFSGMLERTTDERVTDRNRHYLRRLRAASQQLGEYVDALLSLARCSQAPLRRSDVNLSTLATSALTDLQERDADRRAVVHVQPGLLVRGDPSLLKMALENLLGNAWKFTGRRRVAQIDFAAEAGAGGETVYCVKDNGAGFDSNWAGKLFGTFQRLHSQEEFPGTGIGLANVHRIITRHGGRIWAESVEGAGATFRFTLPA